MPARRVTAPLPTATRLCDTARDRLADLDLRGGTQALLDAVTTLNRDLEATTPWQIAKDPARGAELDRVLLRHVRSATTLVEALSPVLPGDSERRPPGGEAR